MLKIIIEYTEPSGPHGYGHKEETFKCEGSLNDCIRKYYEWVFESTRIFGPDYRDIKNYFSNCRGLAIYDNINIVDISSELIKLCETFKKDILYL